LSVQSVDFIEAFKYSHGSVGVSSIIGDPTLSPFNFDFCEICVVRKFISNGFATSLLAGV